MPKGIRKDGKPTAGARIGKGAGYGGPAKGASTAKPFAAGDEHRGAHNAAAKASKEDRAAALIDHLEKLARTAARESDQIQATMGAISHLIGSPVQKNINENTTVRTVIRAPAEPKDLAEWQQQHLPKHLNS